MSIITVISRLRNKQPTLGIEFNKLTTKLQNRPIYIIRTASGLLVVTLMSCFFVYRFPENIVVTGTLLPTAEIRDVQIPQGGIVERLFVKNGSRVAKDQPLFELRSQIDKSEQESIYVTLERLNDSMDNLTKQRQAIVTAFRLDQKALQDSLQINQYILRSLKELYKEAAASKLQYLTQLEKTNQIKFKLKSDYSTFRQQLLQVDNQILSAQRLHAEARAKSTAIKERIDANYVVAPISGTVFSLVGKASDYVGQASETILRIVPDGRLLVDIEIPVSKIGFIRTGLPVYLSLDSYPSTDFGYLRGTITSVDSSSTIQENTRDTQTVPTSFYSAKVELSTQYLMTPSGKKLFLRSGMSTQAKIKLRDATLFQMLFQSLSEKATSIQNI